MNSKEQDFLQSLLGSLLSVHDLTKLMVTDIKMVAKSDSLVDYMADAYSLPDDYRRDFDKLPTKERNQLKLVAVFAFFLKKMGIYDITTADPGDSAKRIPELFEEHGTLFMANGLMMACSKKDMAESKL